MPDDPLKGARSQPKSPQITVRRSGQLVLTQAAIAMLGDEVTHVQFGFDPETRAVALRTATKETKGSYQLRPQDNGTSLVHGKRFLSPITTSPRRRPRRSRRSASATG